MRIKHAREVLRRYRMASVPTFIWGPPGIGKTSLPEQLAANLGIGYKVFKPVLRDTVDLRGLAAIDLKRNVTRWLAPDELPNVKRDGPEGIWLFDEYNVATVPMQNACMGLIQEGRIEDWEKPPGWWIIATGNHAGQGAITRTPPPTANRFGHIDLEANIDDWTEWANEANLESTLIAFLRYRPALLHDMNAGGGENNDKRIFPTPRSWANLDKACAPNEELGLPDLFADNLSTDARALRDHVCAGLVGVGPTAELISYLDMVHKAPSIDEILQRPETTPVPSELGVLYAVSTGLARHVTDPSVFERGLTYMQRTSKEFEVMYVMDTTTRSDVRSKLQSCRAYTKWCVANKDILLGVR